MKVFGGASENIQVHVAFDACCFPSFCMLPEMPVFVSSFRPVRMVVGNPDGVVGEISFDEALVVMSVDINNWFDVVVIFYHPKPFSYIGDQLLIAQASVFFQIEHRCQVASENRGVPNEMIGLLYRICIGFIVMVGAPKHTDAPRLLPVVLEMSVHMGNALRRFHKYKSDRMAVQGGSGKFIPFDFTLMVRNINTMHAVMLDGIVFVIVWVDFVEGHQVLQQAGMFFPNVCCTGQQDEAEGKKD